MTFPWEYCECGCHGHSLVLGGLEFWCQQDIREWPSGSAQKGMQLISVVVYQGHGFYGKMLGQYRPMVASFDDVWPFANGVVRPFLLARLVELYEHQAVHEKYFDTTELLAAVAAKQLKEPK